MYVLPLTIFDQHLAGAYSSFPAVVLQWHNYTMKIIVNCCCQEKGSETKNMELLQYLERGDERFLQHSKDMNDTLLQKMEADTNALLRLMAHGGSAGSSIPQMQ